MGTSLTSGFAVSVIGISTVFVALVALVAVVSMTARILARSQPLAAAAPSRERPLPAVEARSALDLQRVAVAAFAAHHHRRAARRQPQAAISRWSIAGRLRQLAPFQR